MHLLLVLWGWLLSLSKSLGVSTCARFCVGLLVHSSCGLRRRQSYGEILADYVFWAFESHIVSKQQCINSVPLSLFYAQISRVMVSSSWLSGRSGAGPNGSLLTLIRQFRVRWLFSARWSLSNMVTLRQPQPSFTGFDCYLRHSELRNLRVGHVAFAGDVRLRGEALAGLNLWCTKSADLQWVSVRDPLAADMLLSLCQGRTPESFVFSRERMSLLELFQSSQLWAGFAFPMFLMHSLRHGGATWDFLERKLPLEDIMTDVPSILESKNERETSIKQYVGWPYVNDLHALGLCFYQLNHQQKIHIHIRGWQWMELSWLYVLSVREHAWSICATYFPRIAT